MEAHEQIKSLLKHISAGLFEKEQIVAMALLSAVAGESIFLLGPPGTAKSLVSRRLKLAFDKAQSFEYLMSRFSTPDDIFGPVSISLLKNEDRYERVVDGYMPTATVVFLDEIWKAGPAIQNALLTAINERIFQNGDKTIDLPMKALIAASNELPAPDEGLEALWDRFLVRMVSDNIKSEATFFKMVRQQVMPDVEIPKSLLITDSLYNKWQQQLVDVEIPDAVCNVVSNIRKRLVQAARGENVAPMDYYVSDRRWKKCFHIMQASAFLNGRTAIDLTDVVLLIHCLWNKVETMLPVIDIVAGSITDDVLKQLDDIDKACDTALAEIKNPGMHLHNQGVHADVRRGFFDYELQKFPLGKCVIDKLHYLKVSDSSDSQALLYRDSKKNCWIIKIPSSNLPFNYNNGNQEDLQVITIRRVQGGIIVNGTPYPFEGEKIIGTAAALVLDKEINLLENVLQPKFDSMSTLFDETTNVFLSKRDIRLAKNYLKKCSNKLEATRLKLHNTSDLLSKG